MIGRLLFLLACGSAVSLPCSAREPLNAAEARQRFLLPLEPDGATSIADAKASLEKAADAAVPVVIAGRIGAREHDPFLEGKASFIMIDVVDDAHAKKPGHDADNCPFCKKRQAKLPLAAVEFVDDAGKVVPIDSRQLFGLAKGREVVVRGKATYNTKLPMPVVQVTADGIHVRAAP